MPGSEKIGSEEEGSRRLWKRGLIPLCFLREKVGEERACGSPAPPNYWGAEAKGKDSAAP